MIHLFKTPLELIKMHARKKLLLKIIDTVLNHSINYLTTI